MTELSTEPDQPQPDRPADPAPAPARGGDLGLPEFPPLTWSRTEIRHSLDELYAWGERLAVEAIGWYLAEKRRKSRWARALRGLALVLAAAGAAVPVVALSAGRPAAGNWGFLVLALASGCVAYDRFFGYSSSWQRYVATATSLRTQLIEYQAAWAREMVAMAAREPDRTDAVRLIDFVRAFAAGVNDTIRTETEAWLVEFHTRLTELEARLQQAEAGPARRGGVPGVALPGPARSVEDTAEIAAGRSRGANRSPDH